MLPLLWGVGVVRLSHRAIGNLKLIHPRNGAHLRLAGGSRGQLRLMIFHLPLAGWGEHSAAEGKLGLRGYFLRLDGLREPPGPVEVNAGEQGEA